MFSKLRIVILTSLYFLVLSPLSLHLYSQSSDQNFPTAAVSNEIVGKIEPRAMGDSRVTTYYYQFSGNQGDLFINVVTTNFTGDIDVYTADRILPLTKMVIYASDSANETGRLIYLRKPERLILRIQGRPPGDDAATFRIKFGGSFVASTEETPDDAPRVSPERLASESGIIVNSAGAIIETRPRKTEEEAESQEDAEDNRASRNVSEPPRKPETDREAILRAVREGRDARSTTRPSQDLPTRSNRQVAEPPTNEKAASKDSKTTSEPAPNPLASIKLVILLKNGTIIEHSMNEIRTFGYDKGTLNVVPVSGKALRYSILDIERVTIQ